MADLLIGRFSGLTDGNALSDYLRQSVFALYVQDNIHVTSHLSINLGLRWEPDLPAYDKFGRGDQFSWALFNQNVHSAAYPNAPAGLIFSTDSQNSNGKAFTESHWLASSPRVGLIWDPKGDGRQTIRTSFALMHETTELFYPERWTTNPPYASSQTLSSGQFSNPFASYVSPGGVPGDPYPGVALFPVGGMYISIPPNVRPTYVMEWNFSYERQLGPDWLITATYLGNASRHIWASTDVNYAVYTGSPATSTAANTNQRRLTYLSNPSQGQYYGEIQQTDDGAVAEYHGLLLSAKHRFARNIFFLTSFTWSHCVSDWDFGGELGGTQYQNPLNRGGERGACGFDHRLNWTNSMVAVSPGIGSAVSKMITKDWQISPWFTMLSGPPITLTDGGVDVSRSGQLKDRPNVILPNNVIPANQTPQQWFNPAAFAMQPVGTFGNLGRNAVYGPGLINLDVAMSRQFVIKESAKLELRADFFNIVNHGNGTNPNNAITSSLTTSITSSTFGQITAFGPPRIIQMALKFYF